MHRNGEALRVLLTGAAGDDLAAALDQDAAVSMVHDGQADVALHVISSEHELGDEITKLRARSGAPLILGAYGEPNGIVEAGMRYGAVDVLVLPQPLETVVFALRKAATNHTKNGGERAKASVVTVFSPKGGSGKTVIATNVAVAAQKAGLQTILLDFDLQFGDAALALAIPPRATIADLAAASGDIDSEKLNAFVCSDARSSLTLLAAPKRPEEAQIVGPGELSAAIDAARNAYSAVVIDTGPQFDAAMLSALDRSDRLLLVVNPEVTSLKNVRIGLETIERLGFHRDRISLVANRIGAAGAVTRNEIEEALEVQIAFELPDDAAVPEAINRATPVVLAEPASRFSRAISGMAGTIFAGAPARGSARPAQRKSLLRGRR